MREGWETKALGEVIQLEYGKPLSKEDRHNDGKYAAYGANGIKCRTDKYFFDKPSIIVGRKGSAGEVTLTEGKFWPLDVTYFVTFDEKRYDLIFLYHCLQSLRLTKLAKGVKPGINRNDVYQINFSFPPLPEQNRIVAILDKAFEGIDKAISNTEKNLANARELFESYLSNAFTQKSEGWVSGELSKAVSSVSTGPFGSMLHKSDYIEGGVPIVNPINIRDGRIIPNSSKTVNRETVDRLKTYVLDIGDVVIGRRGEIGRCAVIEEDQAGWLCGTGCFYIKPSNKLNPYFLVKLLRSAKYRAELERVATGATMKNLSNTSLRNLTVTFPPLLEEQHNLVLRLDEFLIETNRLKTIYRKKLMALAELKQSLLQKAFSGELTSTNKVIAFPNLKAAKDTDPFSPEFSAKILAFAYHHHAAKKRQNTFGHVKAQKTLHLVESIAGIDLDRHPIKDAAGPNDFPHMLKAEAWAKEQQFFEFVSRGEGKGYDFKKLTRYDELMAGLFATLKPYQQRLARVVDLIIPKNSQETELLATVHAAWNNLILEGCDITDEAIIREARENWHADKLKIPVAEFKQALCSIRENGLVPDGKAKRVGGQESLF